MGKRLLEKVIALNDSTSFKLLPSTFKYYFTYVHTLVNLQTKRVNVSFNHKILHYNVLFFALQIGISDKYTTDYNQCIYTEKIVLSNQQNYFVGIYATKFFCCANKTFCYINQILVTSTKCFVRTTKCFVSITKKVLLHTFFSQCTVNRAVFRLVGALY